MRVNQQGHLGPHIRRTPVICRPHHTPIQLLAGMLQWGQRIYTQLQTASRWRVETSHRLDRRGIRLQFQKKSTLRTLSKLLEAHRLVPSRHIFAHLGMNPTWTPWD